MPPKKSILKPYYKMKIIASERDEFAGKKFVRVVETQSVVVTRNLLSSQKIFDSFRTFRVGGINVLQ